MSTPISNFVTQTLRWVGQSIGAPLFKAQSNKPWIGTLPAVAQIVTSTITAVVAGVFAALAGIAGVVCNLVGAANIGADLLRSADIAFFGTRKVPGAVPNCAGVAFSIANAISFTLLAQCLKAKDDKTATESFINNLNQDAARRSPI